MRHFLLVSIAACITPGASSAKGSPPPQLDCVTGLTGITCPLAPTQYSNFAGSNRVSNYNCSAGTFDGNEKVFVLDLAEVSRLSATLVNTDGRDRSLFLIGDTCDEQACRRGGFTTLSVAGLPAGRYYLVVDGVTSTDNGDFTLAVDCSTFARPVTCGTTLFGEVTSGANDLFTWDCTNQLSGPENTYALDIVGQGTLRATFLQKSDPNLHIILTDAAFDYAALTCAADHPDSAKIWNVSPGRYYATVDGLTGASGTYDIEFGCASRLDCTSARPLDVTVPTTINGDTTGKSNTVDEYLCVESTNGPPGERDGYSGGEDIYEFTITATTLLFFDFQPSNPDMELLLLSDCDEGSCLSEGGCSESLAPGTYRLVVDGRNGVAGPYTIKPIILPAPTIRNRWYDCPECPDPTTCGQTPDETELKRWQFNSGNFCGSACDFAMYVVVPCGTEMHLPFWDGETGHMEIYDVLKGQAIDLVATNELPANAPIDAACRYTDTGTRIQWEDSGCSAIPCPTRTCGGGVDCRTNAKVMDVQMLGTPNLCGVFRVDLLNWGGWYWELYANCTADLTEQFFIYRDICSALISFRARPEVGITNLWFSDDSCAENFAHGTMLLENVGCVEATQFEIVIDQAPPAPSNPKIIRVDIPAGQPLLVTWGYQMTVQPVELTFRVDPLGNTPECSEDLNGNVGCGQAAELKREWSIEVCGSLCSIIPNAGPLKHICDGSPCVLDAGGSDFRCNGAGVPEYRWEDIAGNPLPGCDWSTSPICDIPPSTLPPGKSRFTLLTRCSGDPTGCSETTETAVIVGSNVPPDPLGNILRAYRDGNDVQFVWSGNICVGTSGFRIYEDGDPELPMVTRSLLPDADPTDLLAVDRNGVIDLPQPLGHYQLVGVSCDGDLEGAY